MSSAVDLRSEGGAQADDLERSLRETCTRARRAARVLASADTASKNAVLDALARDLESDSARGRVLEANAADLAAARAAGSSEAMLDRLALTPARLDALVASLREVASLEDPVGRVTELRRRPSGILVGQQRIPLGVIAMIYEARPNVTVDSAALCLKSGNAVALRGGKEAARSNAALGELVRHALASAGLPEEAVQIVPPLSRDETRILVGLVGLIDLVIPRGGEGLIRFVAEHARVPVIQHYKGVCHLYVDQGGDIDMAARLVENGKLQRPGVCNALECLLVHESAAGDLLPRVDSLASRGLEVRADEAARARMPRAKPATEADFGCEFLAPILAVRVVSSMDDALAHIERYGSGHTEAICTRDYASAQRFLREVDASCVLVNASTRFNDGGQLGLGAEIGISTTKLHAYGPMGLESLTTLKWIVYGEGQVRPST